MTATRNGDRHGRSGASNTVSAGLVGSVLAVLLAVLLWGSAVTAAERTVHGVAVTPESGRYLVLKDVNLRDEPTTKSKKLGKLEKGQKVEAVGAPKDKDWLAVKAANGEEGFAYAPTLIRLLNGALAEDLKGNVSVSDGPSCSYIGRYDGKSEGSDELFDVSDYDLSFTCKNKGKLFKFGAFMFITEAPYELSQDLVHQISIDVREIGDGFDDIFSSTVLYERKADRVVFDSVTLKDFRRPPTVKSLPAKTVREALAGAIEISLSAWNDKVWRTLAELKPSED